MAQTRMVNVCQDIIARWREKKEIDEEQGYIFLDGILDEISCPEEEAGMDYKMVSTKINEMWQYKMFKELTVEEAFLYGGLWGGIKLTEMNRKRSGQRKTIEELARVYSNKLWFFETIDLNPGIRHKDLAQKGNQSTSQLSQFVSGVVKEGLISYNRVGREKYYYLQKQGELVYAELKKNHNYECKNVIKWPKRMASTNDVKLEAMALSLYGETIDGPDSQSFWGYDPRADHKIRAVQNRIFSLKNSENENIAVFKSEREEADIPCIKIESMLAIENN